MREFLSRHEFGKQEGFRWRNPSEVSRIEGFSDAVFGFAVTLLVVSLEVPKTFDELLAGMHGFLPFAAGFAILFVVWTSQYRWFRQYGLQDGPSLWLNAGLLFVILFFVYPLKFLFTWLFDQWMGGSGTVKLPSGDIVPMVSSAQINHLMMIYGAAYLAVFGMLFLLHVHAWRRREDLELTPFELFVTRQTLQEQGVQMSIGLLSIILAWLGQPGLSGLIYMMVAPSIAVQATLMGRKRRKLFGM